MLEVLEPGDRWKSLWEDTSEREIFSHPDYCSLYNQEDILPRCLKFQSTNGSLMVSIVLRRIDDTDYWDIISPFGYGGIYITDSVGCDNRLLYDFWSELFVWANRNNIVSLFYKVLDGAQGVELPVKPVQANSHIVRSLDLSCSEVWNDYEYKVRKNVRRAKKDGVSIIRDDNGQYLDGFMNVYKDTMSRRSALPGHVFDRNYFRTLMLNLTGRYTFFHATLNDAIVSSELVLISKYNIYSFLGGTISEYFPHRPNDLLKHAIIEWGISENKKGFILGGGYGARKDGIFRYKKSFAPKGERDFGVYKIVFNPHIYDLLSNEDNSFFPFYRSTL